MVDHYVEEAQRYHSLAMRQRLEIAYTREENQRLKVRVGVLGDQLSSALEGAMESWDDVERVQQEACGFALGAGMEIGETERAAGTWKNAAEVYGSERDEAIVAMRGALGACGFALGAGMEVGALEHERAAALREAADWADSNPRVSSIGAALVKALKQRDAALARAEAAEADAHQQRVERDAMFDTAESALARVERLEVELFEARAERDGLRAALQVGLDQAYRVEQLEKALEATASAWTHEAGQGDGIMEEHGSVLDEARAALREGKP